MKHQLNIAAVPYCASCSRFISEELAQTLITKELLKSKEACPAGIEWFDAEFPEGCSYIELRNRLAADHNQDLECWLLENFGGDTAIAGDYESATVGDYGTATVGDYGTAIAGYRGTATAGYSGSATAGEQGSATAGNYGTAIAGADGSAAAGEYGTIIISYWDSANVRYRSVVGYVGENGIETNVAYIVEEGKLVKK